MKRTVVYADFLRQRYAGLVDGPLIAITALVFDYLYAQTGINPGLSTISYIMFRVLVILQLPGILYFIICWAFRNGQTPGMSVAHIRVVDSNFETMRLFKAMIRYISMVITSPIGFFVYHRMMVDPKRQTLYDKLSGTFVIQTSQKQPSQYALIGAYLVNALLIAVLIYLPMKFYYPMYSVNDMTRAPIWALLGKKQQFTIKPEAASYYEAGQAFLTQAKRLDPKETKYEDKLRLIAQSARGEFKQALEFDPNNPRIYAALGSAYSFLTSDIAKQNQFDAYKKAAQLDPHNPLYIFSAGVSAMRLDLNVEAISYFKQSIEKNKSHAPSYISLGDAYARIKEYANARSSYQTAISLHEKSNNKGSNDTQIENVKERLRNLNL